MVEKGSQDTRIPDVDGITHLTGSLVLASTSVASEDAPVPASVSDADEDEGDVSIVAAARRRASLSKVVSCLTPFHSGGMHTCAHADFHARKHARM